MPRIDNGVYSLTIPRPKCEAGDLKFTVEVYDIGINDSLLTFIDGSQGLWSECMDLFKNFTFKKEVSHG